MNKSTNQNSSQLNFNGLLRTLILCCCLAALPLRASVVGWGTNEYGQLTIPTNVLVAAKAVAAGGWHGLAVTISNSVVAWGVNDYGQTNVPANAAGAAAVAAGFDHSLALMPDGKVIGWGITSNQYYGDPEWFGQADVPADITNAVAISAGAFHSMALRADGTVEAWGYNFYGQCNVPAGLSNVVAIACGGYFSLALKNDGTVAAWGDNYYGQTNLPADLTNVVAVAAGGLHGLALKSNGTVKGWGARGVTDFTQDFGQENAPASVTNAVGIAGGFFHSVALLRDGTIKQWGDTSQGQAKFQGFANSPTNQNAVLSVSAGYAHTYVLKNDLPVIRAQANNVVTPTNRMTTLTVKVTGITPLWGTWWGRDWATNLPWVVFTNLPSGSFFDNGIVQANFATNNPAASAQFTLFLYPNHPALTEASTNSFYLVVTNSMGSVTSAPAMLTVVVPPGISSQPVNVATNVGATVFFTVGTTGSQLSYQWYLNNVALTNNPTSQSNVLELDNVSTNDAGNYRVVITNALGSVTSSVATLAVAGAPAITLQPASTSVVVNNNVSFTASVSGADPLVYQWYFYSGTNAPIDSLPDGTNASYTVWSAQANNAGNYFLIVTNGFGSVTSSVAVLTVQTPPLFSAQPANVVTATNRAVSFVAKANGATPMRATWWRTGSVSNLASVLFSNNTTSVNFSGGNAQAAIATNSPAGTTQFTLNLLATYSALTNVSTNSFYVVLSNSLGTVTSTPATLTVLVPPMITSQPVSVATNVGATAFFAVGSTGSQPLGYQWYLNGVALASNPTSQANVLELDNVSTNDAGNYQVVISNAVGSVTSSVATLTVDGSPAITLQPTNTSVALNGNVTFTAIAGGADPLVYQWYFYSSSNAPIDSLPNGTNAGYTVWNAQTNNAGNYFLIVTNGFGSVTSSVVVLTVQIPPLVSAQPTNVLTATNRAVSFVVKANGTTPLRATWWRSGSVSSLASVVFSNNTASTSFSGGNAQASITTNSPAGTTQFTLNLQGTYSALTSASTNSFYVVLSNSLGTVTSTSATLTVLEPPWITTQPVSLATNVGATVFFAVGSTGSQPLIYQWYLNSAALTNNPTSQTNVLELDNISANDVGNYQVVITNAVGSVTSSVVHLLPLSNGSQTPPQLWLLSHDPNGGDGIMIALEAGRNYRVQSSTDLLSWIDFTNFLSPSSLVVFTNSLYSNLPLIYYRVVTP
jgi:hypothetical protein